MPRRELEVELQERVVAINRVSKVVKGGKRFRFAVLVVVGEFGAARVLLKPSPAGTGVIAGGVVRAIMELGGVKDVVTKVTGRTSNAINVAHATLEAIKITRTSDEIMKLRGLAGEVDTEESAPEEAIIGE